MPAMKRQQGPPAIRVAVAAPFPEMVRLHESTAEYADELEVCAMISDAESVLDQAQRLQPDVLLLSEELGPTRHDTLARLGALAPTTRLVMLVADVGAAAVPIADGVVRLDAPAAELRAAIIAATGRAPANQAPPAHSRQAPPARPVALVPDLPSGATGATPPPEADAGERRPCRTIVLFSGKGGVGTSIVTTNLATALAIRGARVAVLDLDLQFGDVAMLLHLETHPLTIDSVAQRGDLDGAALEAALATSADGVRALLAPATPEASDLVTVAGVESLVAALARSHDYLVIDSPAVLEERIVRVMEMADQVLLVSSPGVTSVKDTKVTLRLLQSLGFEADRVALVINQAQPRPGFPAGDIERALRFPVLSSLPFEPRMDAAVESGRPLVAGAPRSAFSRQLTLITDHVGRGTGPRSPDGGAHHAARWRLRLRR